MTKFPKIQWSNKMTKKDYIAIADVIGEAIAEATKTEKPKSVFDAVEVRIRNRIIRGLCAIFSEDNPRFDVDLFTKHILVQSRANLED